MSIAALLSLVLYIVVLALIIWLALWLVQVIAPPEPFNKVLRVLITVIGVLLLIVVLLNFVGWGPVVVTPPLKP